MTLEWLVRRDRASIAESEKALAAIAGRIASLSESEHWSQHDFVELLTLFNSASYLFLYVQSNAAAIDADRVRPFHDALHRDDTLDARLSRRLAGIAWSDPDLDESRRRFLAHFERKRSQGRSVAMVEDRCLAEAKGVSRRMEIDQAGLLDRLDGGSSAARPSARFHNLVGRTGSAASRRKLHRAWTQVSAPHLDALQACVDSMIAARHERARDLDEPVLAATFAHCSIPPSQATAFVDRFLALAIEEHRGLLGEIERDLGVTEHPLDHFPALLERRRGGRRMLRFALEPCLDFIFAVAGRVFGIELQRVDDGTSELFVAQVACGQWTMGHVLFDLWDMGPQRRVANQTQGWRNRTDWEGLVQLPIASVSCKFQRGADDRPRITFQNLHSLFHEFGHALNHLLIRKRLPNQSGLEYLPVERLEHLAMWFERWVFHPALADHLDLSESEREGLALCRSLKALEYRRTHLDRAVIAALDLDVHAVPGLSLREAFARLDVRSGVSAWTRIEEYVPYFFWPMLIANPGGYFGYLWSASFAADCFEAFRRPLDRLPRCTTDAAPFAGCFDYAVSCPAPDVRASFGFYRELAAA